jgi:Domain of unknown function (DUF4406)
MIEKKTAEVLYVIGPYRAKTIREIVENIRRAEAVALKYWQKGYVVICPHTNSALFDGAITDEVILQGDIEIMKRCDGVVILPGWQKSSGSIGEIKVAVEMRLQILWEDGAYQVGCEEKLEAVA